MGKLVFRRFVAFILDYIIIVVYALFLFGIAKSVNLNELVMTPFIGQLLGFFSLTLPVFLYFFLTEKGKNKSTIGKRVMNIAIGSKREDKVTKILLRNMLKFIPWEVAHIGVHWIVFYTKQEIGVPIWVWLLLITPQMVVLAYVLSIIISRGESSIYDNFSNTNIKMTNPSTR